MLNQLQAPSMPPYGYFSPGSPMPLASSAPYNPQAPSPMPHQPAGLLTPIPNPAGALATMASYRSPTTAQLLAAPYPPASVSVVSGPASSASDSYQNTLFTSAPSHTYSQAASHMDSIGVPGPGPSTLASRAGAGASTDADVRNPSNINFSSALWPAKGPIVYTQEQLAVKFQASCSGKPWEVWEKHPIVTYVVGPTVSPSRLETILGSRRHDPEWYGVSAEK